MKKLVLVCFIFLILFSGSVYGLCSEGQIDINTASAEKLDELYGIGPVKADSIIDSRPFKSVDELINVSGIGEITLGKIKAQGLACVSDEEEEKPTEEEIEVNETAPTETTEEGIIEDVEEKVIENINEENNKSSKGWAGEVAEVKAQTPLTPEVIILTPQTIKSNGDNKILDNSTYAKYGFVVFCILLGLLFILRRKNKLKNEFRQEGDKRD